MTHSTLPLRIPVLALVPVVCAAILFSACDAIFVSGCINATPVPKLNSISPTTINTQTLPMTVIVSGSDFKTWSAIFWNSASLPTTYIDSRHLSVTVTPQMLTWVDISSGTGLISVSTAGHPDGDIFGCPNGGSSSTITIIIIGD
jgi:hypothetical protein